MRQNGRREQVSLLRSTDDAHGKEHFHGLSPMQIWHQAREGKVPPHWLVFRPRHTNLYVVVGLTVMFTMLPCMLFFTGTFYPAAMDEGPIDLLTLMLRAVLPSLCLAIVASTLVVRVVKRTQDALLVVFPEGVVQCERCSDEARRYFHVIAFADLADMRQRTTLTTNTSVVELRYKDGKEGEWHANSKFAPSAWLARRVVGNYTNYMKYKREGQEE